MDCYTDASTLQERALLTKDIQFAHVRAKLWANHVCHAGKRIEAGTSLYLHKDRLMRCNSVPGRRGEGLAGSVFCR